MEDHSLRVGRQSLSLRQMFAVGLGCTQCKLQKAPCVAVFRILGHKDELLRVLAPQIIDVVGSAPGKDEPVSSFEKAVPTGVDLAAEPVRVCLRGFSDGRR